MIYEIRDGSCPTENADGGGRAAAGGGGNTDCVNTPGVYTQEAESVIYCLAVRWKAERLVEAVVSDLARLDMLCFFQRQYILWSNWQLRAQRQ